MGLFDVFKKKEVKGLDLPPPPPLDGAFGSDKKQLGNHFPELPTPPSLELPDMKMPQNIARNHNDSFTQKPTQSFEMPSVPNPVQIEEETDIPNMKFPKLEDYDDFHSIQEPEPTFPQFESKSVIEHPLGIEAEEDEPEMVHTNQEIKRFEEVKKEYHKPIVDGPVYIKTSDYNELLSSVDIIKKKIKESDIIANQLEKISKNKDSELENWKSQLEAVEKKLMYVDKTLFER